MATPFQKQVWAALRLIPRGRVTTYGAIAKYLGTGAVRAVGSAVGKNPDAPVVPCHRVVRTDGSIGRYSGGDGVTTKIAMLADEGVRVEDGRIVDFDGVVWTYPQQSVTSPSGS